VLKVGACFEHLVVVRPSLPVRVIILLLVRRRVDVVGHNQDILTVWLPCRFGRVHKQVLAAQASAKVGWV